MIILGFIFCTYTKAITKLDFYLSLCCKIKTNKEKNNKVGNIQNKKRHYSSLL